MQPFSHPLGASPALSPPLGRRARPRSPPFYFSQRGRQSRAKFRFEINTTPRGGTRPADWTQPNAPVLSFKADMNGRDVGHRGRVVIQDGEGKTQLFYANMWSFKVRIFWGLSACCWLWFKTRAKGQNAYLQVCRSIATTLVPYLFMLYAFYLTFVTYAFFSLHCCYYLKHLVFIIRFIHM